MNRTKASLFALMAGCFFCGVVADRNARGGFQKLSLIAPPPVSFRMPISDHENMKAIFKLSKGGPGSIVMLGDSLTALAPWAELTGCSRVVGRGISAEKTADILDRVADTVALRPAAVFLMAGVNDVGANVPLSDSIRNLEAIFSAFSAANVPLYFQYVLPVSDTPHYPGLNKQVARFNTAAAELLAKFPRVKTIDMRKSFSDEFGFLRSDLRRDEVHLTSLGYQVWAESIASGINPLCHGDKGAAPTN